MALHSYFEARWPELSFYGKKHPAEPPIFSLYSTLIRPVLGASRRENMSRGPPGWSGQEEWPHEEVHLAQPREGVALGPKPARGTFKISKQTESHPSPEV